MSSFFHSSESAPPTTLHEAVLDSVSSVRKSIPEQHRAHFDTLRQEIIDFAQAHNISRELLAKPQDLQEAASKLSTPDLAQLATLLERFEYLLVHKEPQESTDPLEYAEKYYHLREQYTYQVSLLEQVGILKEGVIIGIDGQEYFIPTLEQIASRLFERREILTTKRDQGFVKLLLVPFGMSLDDLYKILEQFLLGYKQTHPDFDLDEDDPLFIWPDCVGADRNNSFVYYPESFDEWNHGGRTKFQILKEQNESFISGRRWTLPPTAGSATGGTASVGVVGGNGTGDGAETPGWTIHLFQPSDLLHPNSSGFAHIPREGEGTPKGDKVPRPPLEAGNTPGEYLFTLRKSSGNKDFPYSQESGMTPEDWIMAFMIHLEETGKPLDNDGSPKESVNFCLGAFFSSDDFIPGAYWIRQSVYVGSCSNTPAVDFGVRTSVII